MDGEKRRRRSPPLQCVTKHAVTACPSTASCGAHSTAVLQAIELGYRHFNTAALYNSEQPLGEAIAEAVNRRLIRSHRGLMESDFRSAAEATRRMWDRVLTSKRANVACDSSTSTSKKKSKDRDLLSGLLVRKEEETRENSDLRVGRASSDLEWSFFTSKKTRKWKGRGEGREWMWWRRVSFRRMTPLGEPPI